MQSTLILMGLLRSLRILATIAFAASRSLRRRAASVPTVPRAPRRPRRSPAVPARFAASLVCRRRRCAHRDITAQTVRPLQCAAQWTVKVWVFAALERYCFTFVDFQFRTYRLPSYSCIEQWRSIPYSVFRGLIAWHFPAAGHLHSCPLLLSIKFDESI